mmetsp:Transcript_58934/g.140676  ORF Transcript_58934/g.140676 Transcript_58934/m.140676 type:complete len:92 (+) Transcript_58934:96-371(+)
MREGEAAWYSRSMSSIFAHKFHEEPLLLIRNEDFLHSPTAHLSGNNRICPSTTSWLRHPIGLKGRWGWGSIWHSRLQVLCCQVTTTKMHRM